MFQVAVLEPIIAGQCRTNPWQAVPNWLWCRNTNAGLTQMKYRWKCRCRTKFFPAFRHSLIMLYTFPVHHQQYGRENVFFPEIHSPSVFGRDGVLYSFLSQQCVNMRVYPFPPPAVWTRRCIPFHSMLSNRSPTGMNKNNDAGSCRYRNKGTQSGTKMLRYRNEMLGAGIPMPGALVSLPMPSYGTNALRKCLWYTLCNLHQILAESFLWHNWVFKKFCNMSIIKIIFVSAVG